MAVLEAGVKAQRKLIKKLRRQRDEARKELAAIAYKVIPPPAEGEPCLEYQALVEMLEDIPRGLRTLDEVMQHVHDATLL